MTYPLTHRVNAHKDAGRRMRRRFKSFNIGRVLVPKGVYRECIGGVQVVYKGCIGGV